MKRVADIASGLLPKWEKCPNCVNGWIEKRVGAFATAMVRCSCWRIHQQKIAEVAAAAKEKA